MDTARIDVVGKYRWELLMDIDNSLNDGIVKRETKVHSVTTTSISSLIHAIATAGISHSSNFDVGGTFKITSVNVKAGIDANLKTTLEATLKKEEDVTTESSKTEIYEVGPKSRLLTLYRLVFCGPGITYQTDTISSTKHDIEDVVISCQAKQVYFLKDIEVIYPSDEASCPSNVLLENNHTSSNLNFGFSVDLPKVFLVPIRTSRVEEAASDIRHIRQKEENKDYKDLAKGVNGDYRYLKMYQNPQSDQRVGHLKLVRSAKRLSPEPDEEGWSWWNLNHERGRDYLYLCWKFTDV